MRYGKALYFAAAAWLAMGVAAYGLALRKYAAENIPREGRAEEHRGRVEWSRASSLGGGIEFALEGAGTVYFLPDEFLVTPQARRDAAGLIKGGLRIWFKAADSMVLELDVNDGTPFVRKLVTWETSSSLRRNLPERMRAAGSRYFALGLLLLPLAAALRLGARRAMARARTRAEGGAQPD